MMSPADREEAARQVLPTDVYAYYAAGSGQGQTYASQETAWADVLLRPRLLRDTSRIETKTTVLGTPVAGPVLVAPTAGHGLVHIDGEAASARGAAAAGSLMVLSMRGSSRVEAVAAAGPYWQQIYVLSDRGVSDEVAVRAAAAGARAIVLTVDTPFVTAKAGGGYPSTMPLQGVIEALDRREAGETGLLAVPVRPDDISRLAELTGLPVVVKGVLRGDEARALSRQWCLGHRRIHARRPPARRSGPHSPGACRGRRRGGRYGGLCRRWRAHRYRRPAGSGARRPRGPAGPAGAVGASHRRPGWGPAPARGRRTGNGGGARAGGRHQPG